MSHRGDKYGIAALLFLLLTLLSSCGQPTGQNVAAVDYNQYISAHGAAAYTENLYIFFENGYLTCIDYSNPSQSSPLCFQADCNHRSSTCTSWLNTPSRAIYASGDNLYYIDSDKSKTPGLYRMDLSGGRRERVKDLEILENEYWPGISTFGYSFRVYGSCFGVRCYSL